MKKIVLNSERELFISCVLSLPLIPMTVLILMKIFEVIFIMFFWIIIFGFIYYSYHSILYVYDDKFIIKSFKKDYIINFEEILLINEIKNINYPLTNVKYKLVLKNYVNNIPEKFLIIQNSKFKNIYDNLKIKKYKTFTLS